MLYHITSQLRVWSVKNIFELVNAFLTGVGYLQKFPMSRIKGQQEPCNVLEVLTDILEPDKKYTIGEDTRRGSAIIEKVELFLLKHEKEAKRATVISDGRHRAVALVIAMAFGAEGLEPSFHDVEADDVRSDSFESNVAHEYATKLSKIDKLNEVIGLIETGEATKEADIQKLGLSRYGAQEYWAKAALVRNHGMEVDDVASLNKEVARKAASSADAKATIAEVEESSNKPPKAVSGKVIREMSTLLKEGLVPETDMSLRIVNALASGDEIRFKDLCFEILKANRAN